MMVSVLHNSVDLIIRCALSGLFYCSLLVSVQFPFWGALDPGSFHAIPTSSTVKRQPAVLITPLFFQCCLRPGTTHLP